jgi:hypothetical protein
MPSVKQRFADNGMHDALGHDAFTVRLGQDFAAWSATIKQLGITGE